MCGTSESWWGPSAWTCFARHECRSALPRISGGCPAGSAEPRAVAWTCSRTREGSVLCVSAVFWAERRQRPLASGCSVARLSLVFDVRAWLLAGPRRASVRFEGRGVCLGANRCPGQSVAVLAPPRGFPARVFASDPALVLAHLGRQVPCFLCVRAILASAAVSSADPVPRPRASVGVAPGCLGAWRP